MNGPLKAIGCRDECEFRPSHGPRVHRWTCAGIPCERVPLSATFRPARRWDRRRQPNCMSSSHQAFRRELFPAGLLGKPWHRALAKWHIWSGVMFSISGGKATGSWFDSGGQGHESSHQRRPHQVSSQTGLQQPGLGRCQRSQICLDINPYLE